VGYGVETNHLIDIQRNFDLGAIGQVDLGKRKHNNQSSAALGKMAFAILGSVMNRLEEEGIISINKSLRDMYSMSMRNKETGEYCFENFLIKDRERPPIVNVGKYRDKRGK